MDYASLIHPTAFDLPDGQLRVLAVESPRKKYSALSSAKITTITRAVPHPSEGRTRRYGCWVRDAMDAAARKDEARLFADGEAVWS